MYSAKIFLALDAILDCDLIFLYSSQASQNSRFSSLNSVRRNALNAARPSETEQKNKHRESWLQCHGNLSSSSALSLLGAPATKTTPHRFFCLSHVVGIKDII